MNEYINISDQFGGEVNVTIDQYRALSDDEFKETTMFGQDVIVDHNAIVVAVSDLSAWYRA